MSYKHIRRASWIAIDANGSEGRLRLLRKDGVITAYIEQTGEWVQVDNGYVEPFTEPVIPVFQVLNTFDASVPAPVEVEFTVEKLTREEASAASGIFR